MNSSPDAAQRALAELSAAASAVADARARLDTARDRRVAAIAAARAAGVTGGAIAAAGSVSRGRVSQLRSLDTLECLPIPDGALMADGVASRRSTRRYGVWPTAWVDGTTGDGITDDGTLFRAHKETVGDLLDSIPPHVRRVFVTGDMRNLTRGGSWDDVRRWGCATPSGWEPAGHWTDKGTPIFRWRGQWRPCSVEILSAVGWHGEDATPEDCYVAWAKLAADLAYVTAPGAPGVLMSTPATTGRDLWLRTIGPRQSWPVLAPAIRDHISLTAGQGRIELRPGSGTVPGVTYLDGRMMYSALVHAMPVGEPERAPGYALDDLIRKPGRWRVIVQVPRGWAHVGLIGRRSADGWDYPCTPGDTWEAWVDACEIRLAREHGWTITASEGLVWPREGKPLDIWRDRLYTLYGGCENPAYRHAVRAIILHGIGAFATGSPTREIHCDTADAVPGDARQVWSDPAGGFRAIVPTGQDAWLAQVSHPEWPATIWARARARLAALAMTFPVESVIAFRTDALYLAGDHSATHDTGARGDFRLKGQLKRSVGWPQTQGELFELKRAVEA